MQAATKNTLKGLCQAKGKTKSGLHGQVVQLFGMSNEFKKLNEDLLDEIVQSKLLKILPPKFEEQKSAS